METKEITYHVKLIAKDGIDYINYVFENLEYESVDYKYIMCVRFPNWDCYSISLGDVGYATVKYVEAGVDKWYDGFNFVPYNYTNIVFLKFIPEKQTVDKNNIIVD